jgi:uncharacterized protein (TIGR03083 family)
VDVDRHLEWLEREGTALGDAADGVDPDLPVGTVPDWSLREVVRHVGGVHRWATAMVRDARTERWDTTLLDAVGGAWPDDGELVDWYRTGLAALVRTLRDAPPDFEGWAFLPAPSARAFWARRQAHETSIHRADAQSCTEAVAPYDPTFAADGVDELLFGFAQRRNDLPDDPPVLRLEATDLDRCWTARLGPEWVDAATDAEAAVTPVADCTVRAPASDLYLLLWNRRTPGADELAGDPSVLEVWRGAVRVRWTE